MTFEAQREKEPRVHLIYQMKCSGSSFIHLLCNPFTKDLNELYLCISS